MSFFKSLFSCCSTGESDQKYMVRTKDGQSQLYNSLDEIDKNVIENQNTQITKIKTQQGLSTLRKQLTEDNKNFIDEQFPHNNTSIGGRLDGTINWKRIPQLIPFGVTPTIFDNKIEPSDVITGHQGDCYFLSSLAALAQSPQTIRQIFKNQTYNKQGIYHLNLRNNGVIEQVVVDDYIPVNQQGIPLYCQPNSKTGQFWVVLVEKAIAKIKGSYHELQVGTPSEIFRAVGHAPAQSIVFSNKPEEKDKIWNILLQYNNKNNPICATTVSQVKSGSNLQNSHTYTVIKTAEFHDQYGAERILKIRNPWKNIDYHGKASKNDSKFWDGINAENKQQFLSFNNNSEYGIATIHFDDFMANFNQIHLSNVHGGGKYLTEKVAFNDGKGKYFEVQIDREGTFTFQLNQSKINHKKVELQLNNHQNHVQQNHENYNEPQQIHIGVGQVQQKLENVHELRHSDAVSHVQQGKVHPNHELGNENEQRYGRSSLIIFQKQKILTNFKFINGTMRYNEQNITLTQKLTPGSYIIYAKIDNIGIAGRTPQNTCISLYSINLATIKPISPLTYKYIFQNAFLNHAQQHKKIEQSQGKVWISWQLLFQKGGYAYFAVGNQKDNNQAVVINFNPVDFDSLHFYLKEPYKNMNEQIIRVMPGQKQIIVAKVKNDPNITSVKFPPKLDIKLQPLFNKNL